MDCHCCEVLRDDRQCCHFHIALANPEHGRRLATFEVTRQSENNGKEVELLKAVIIAGLLITPEVDDLFRGFPFRCFERC